MKMVNGLVFAYLNEAQESSHLDLDCLVLDALGAEEFLVVNLNKYCILRAIFCSKS